MTSHASGAQASAFRVLLGAGVALQLLGDAPGPLTLGAGLVAALMLALGWRDRLAAALLLVGGALLAARTGRLGDPDVSALLTLIAAHLAQPPAPYGSLDARGRVDPGGGWRAPAWRRPLLRALFVLHVALLLVTHASPGVGLALLALACVDPGWIRARRAPEPELVFYDGGCGVCHGFVRFLLAEDPHGRVARFAPLDSDCFRAHVPPDARESLPDSVVVLRHDGRLLTRSAAAAHLLRALGGLWTLLGGTVALLPRAWCDAVYDGIARVRHRIAKAPDAACPLLPPELAARFEH